MHEFGQKEEAVTEEEEEEKTTFSVKHENFLWKGLSSPESSNPGL